MALSAIYIKGFKTFARPVRMPLEGGITAIVGPNGSGKSNVTDAVLFALGEQSAGVLRAGAMGELIFSGSDSLTAAAAAEVTLVFDNASGGISLPYEEVAVTRRISREGDTEYRINGAKSRLQDVRAVAGEAGLGRHSILRQGSVDAIVSGGAAACRLALEEAAGLGVYRRRRLSASRRLERADAQLEQSRRLEAELEDQLQRIEREAVAAREYREIEGRYRKVSLACLYRTATRGLDERRGRLKELDARIGGLSEREVTLRSEEAEIEPRLRALDDRLATLDAMREAMEDRAEDLRAESLRADRNLMRLESTAGNGHDPASAIPRLEENLVRVTEALSDLEKRWEATEKARTESRQKATETRQLVNERQGELSRAREEHTRLTRRLENLRAHLQRLREDFDDAEPAEEYAERLATAAKILQSEAATSEKAATLRRSARESIASGEDLLSGVARRRGTLEAAVGRAESRFRALKVSENAGSEARLHEVLRPRQGFEVAVEAALGELGAGVLAGDFEEGMRLLSDTGPVVVRLDAADPEPMDPPPGRPLIDCVEILDGRYTSGIQRLLGGFYVVETPVENISNNGHVAVTPDGLRMTRTTLSRGSSLDGAFAREARRESARHLLEELEDRPRAILASVETTASETSRSLANVGESAAAVEAVSVRADRVRESLRREANRRLRALRSAGERRQKSEAEANRIEADVAATEHSLVAAAGNETATRIAFERASQEAETAEAESREAEAARSRLRPGLEAGRSRSDRMTRELSRLKELNGSFRRSPEAVGLRATKSAAVLAAAMRERRSRLRSLREEASESQRGYTGRRSEINRRAVELAGELATARAELRRESEDLERAERLSEEAAAEIGAEWGADLATARREAEANPEATEKERRALARKLHAFGDVNLLSLSQESELRDRHEFVSAQRADAEEAANELNRIIHLVDEEIETSFSRTFRRVRGAFGEMVPRMMRGASGSLELSEEGVEIGLRLGRRGWRSLRVLSGGERALLALSFLFSVFLSQGAGTRAAFCVLDEAEAALDDINLARFLSVVDSYRSEGQFLLVTHQKRTMAAADVLYGVTQDATGATVVVSKRTLKE